MTAAAMSRKNGITRAIKASYRNDNYTWSYNRLSL
jgi:hypothetical protein